MLFDPIRIKSVDIRNRIVMPAMVTRFVDIRFGPLDRLTKWYAERAKGGVGLIITESAYVRDYPGRICLKNEDHVSELKNLINKVHEYGSKVVLQINLGRGRIAAQDGVEAVSASDVPFMGLKPRPLSKNEIIMLEEEFEEAVRLATEIGFDGVEIHGAHGYLIQQFLSPYTNKRNDEYGGSLDGRLRLPLELVERAKDYIGNDLLLIFRMCGDEKIEGGITLEDAKLIAKRLVRSGVDIIHVSAGGFDNGAIYWTFPPTSMKEGCNVNIAGEIRKAIDAPVIAVGKIGDPLFAEKVVSGGFADFVSMGRALIADPELPRKALEGRFDEIRPCIYCLRCLDNILWQSSPLKCSVNPFAGREGFEIKPAENVKKIAIIGAGPAGIEAAIVASLRGHKVSLYERQDRIGGKLLIISKIPGKDDYKKLLRYFESILSKLKVDVKLSVNVDSQLLMKENPDAVIIAAGSEPAEPAFPCTDVELIYAEEVILGKKDVGAKVIICGGGLVGSETALYLAKMGKNVTIIEMLGDIASDTDPVTRTFLKDELTKNGVEILTNSKITRISGKEIEYIKGEGPKSHRLVADSIVISLGYKSNRKLCDELKRKGIKFHEIGDVIKPRKIMEAIEEAFEASLKL
jgi:2,4-dienoyl-CoA reductase-like NADH-dependent reductase (Old Yellow Enzyme family)/thioredoxin reductase